MVRAWCVAILLAAAAWAQPASERWVPRESEQLVLVELFTSEGCSSCPPADSLLTDLLSTQPVTGVRIVPLSEHVDYWNQLGWTDPFSSALFSRRQEEYARETTDGVYTPQIVVDGATGIVGSDRARTLTAIREAAARPKGTIDLAWAGTGDTSIEIRTVASPMLAKSTVFLAITEDGLRSDVRRGENGGRKLAHSAVTRRLTAVGTADASGAFARVLPLSLDRGWQRRAVRVVVFAKREPGPVTAIQVLDAR